MKLEAGDVVEVGRTHIVERPRLMRLLDESHARIVLLVAPAGYGKTTLARAWLAARPHTWYRGSSATADVAALALGLAKAAAAVVPGAGERLATRLRVSNGPEREIEVLADLLAEDLSNWPDDAWLGFDDYHFACDSEPTEQFVERMVASCPVKLLVAGRSRPAWATARRLLYGEVFEVGRNLLAMTSEEARQVLTGQVDVQTSGLISLADGWPALLGLASLTDERDVPRDGMPDELYSYFAEELYQAVPAGVQEGLRRLALAPAVTPDVAQSLIGDRADAVIGEALRLGFFLPPSRGRLELHPLLRSFLASKFAEHQDDPDGRLVAGLVRTLLEREEWDDAFELIERFFDGELLVELFESALPRMVDEARLPTLRQWITTAQGHRFDAPVVDLADAEVSMKQGDLYRAHALGVQAARRLESGHTFISKALWLAGISAHLSSRANLALGHFCEAEKVACSATDRRQALWGRFSVIANLDKLDDASKLLADFENSLGSTADECLQLATGRLMLSSLIGKIQETLDAVELVAPLTSRSRDPLIHSSFLNVKAALLALGGRYSDACRSAEQEIEVAHNFGLEFALPHARFHLSVDLWGLRDFRRCTTVLRECERACLKRPDDFLRMNVGILVARCHLTKNCVNEALQVFESYEHPASSPSLHAEYLAWWSLAEALSGEARRARALTSRAEEMSPRVEVTALVPWSNAILALRSKRSSRNKIEEAFRCAITSGNVDAFVMAYRGCPDVLRILCRNDEHHPYLRVILERARDHTIAQNVGLRLPPPPESRGIGALSKREREVLELVSQGLSNREIGKTLFITESTTKVHVRKICQKLGVRTRTEAAMRAAEVSD